MQVGNRQKDTLAKLQAFTSKLRTSTAKQQTVQDKAAAAAKAAAEGAAEQQQRQAEVAAAAAAAEQPAVTNGGPAGDEHYAGKVCEAWDRLWTLCTLVVWQSAKSDVGSDSWCIPYLRSYQLHLSASYSTYQLLLRSHLVATQPIRLLVDQDAAHVPQL